MEIIPFIDHAVVCDRRTLAFGYSREHACYRKKIMPVVHCMYGEAGSSVFHSQVMERLCWLDSHGYDVWLAAIVPIGHLLRRGPRRVYLDSRGDLQSMYRQ